MEQKKSLDLLPEYIKTDKNSKFLSSVLDPLIQTPEIQRIDGYVGTKLAPNYNPLKDFYIESSSYLKNNYALTPALVVKNANSEVADAIALDDLINEIGLQGGLNNNLDRLFKSKYYSYDPPIDWDKLINYSEYYWLPTGPESILIDNNSFDIFTDIIGQETYSLPYVDSDTGLNYKLTNGMKLKFSKTVSDSSITIFEDVEYIVEGVGKSIELIKFELLETNETFLSVYNETFDSDSFDEYPFDGDSKVPLVPEYITINKASKDLNSWTQYNRWFHRNVIEITSKINNRIAVLYNNFKAKRPIIEFKPNLQLFNFGKIGKENIDLIENEKSDALNEIQGTLGFHIDGKLLEEGQRIIFNNDTNLNVKGKIYKVRFDRTSGSAILNLDLVETPNDLDSISINFGNINGGKNYFYDSTSQKWIESQQRITLNQAPLFDLFDNTGISYTKIADKNNFNGNKIFGYDIGNGVPDIVLGFPVNISNGSGIGSYKFKNYFMTDEITVTSNSISNTISTGITFFKDNSNNLETYLNVWNKTVQNYQLPIIEIQTLENNTNTIYINSIDNIGTSTLTVTVFNKRKKIETVVVTATNVITSPLIENLNVNDVIQLQIITDKLPNKNGYYDTPISLINNPLNEKISEISFTELSDHVNSMIDKLTSFDGNFPGSSNLRDIYDYAKFGSQLVINENPVSFAKFFFSKKEHNLIDSIRLAADQYNQFKLNLINYTKNVSSELSPADALDYILNNFNKNKNLNFPYYNSDMLGYGPNKIVTVHNVSDPLTTEYPIGNTFIATELSNKSILVYINGEQLTYIKDYTFNSIGDFVQINSSLSLNDTITIVYYPNTLGCYVPSTPTKLGMYPKFNPEIIQNYDADDNLYWAIKGHDGSLFKTYGTYEIGNEVVDYRDLILLEFEKRVFNNIKIEYNKNIFDLLSIIPGNFRKTDYSIDEVFKILEKDYEYWLGTYNVDGKTNNIFDDSNYKTWNYKNSVDANGNVFSGTWKKIFTYFYDTERPDLRPWEMLGHLSKPSWWDTYYSWTPGSKRTALINAITLGLVEEPPSTKTDVNYARLNFSSIVPVDNSGNLIPPQTFLISENGYLDKQQNWKFGDFSPAEVAWRNSSYYPFILNCLAAILYPCDYSVKMFDVSRTVVNDLNQFIYAGTNSYFDLRKLIADNETLTAGYKNYIVERGKQRYSDYIENLQNDLLFADFNLFYKFEGFTSKEKLQIIIESIDPVSRNKGVILPAEDYNLYFNVSNPLETFNISGIIVQKSNGKFIIKGYDRKNPYFKIFKPIKNLAAPVLTVGGVSESFVDYNDSSYGTNKKLTSQDVTTANSVVSRYYKQGQIVRYNDQFYRVKVNHTPTSNFDASLYQRLPSLPIKGGVTVQKSTNFQNVETTIAYGTEFTSIQEIYDFIIGYGAWLESKGFIFDQYNLDFNKIIDWNFSAQEFLYWTTQNWGDNNLITLSPFANYLKFKSVNSIVDNILDQNYDYSIVTADGTLIEKENLNFFRDGNICTINTINQTQGIFFASLKTIQKEHSLIFNNTTIFNDIIYSRQTGYKQNRIKFYGFKTKNWNGDYFSPGFVYDNVSISDWVKFKSYLPNSVVRYNSNYYQAKNKVNGSAAFNFSDWVKLNEKPYSNLLPNFDYKINQFEDFYSLDIDNFDSEQQRLAQHLVGYTPRNYLNNIITNPISQYKFYQGFIKEKGTKNAINRLDNAIIFNKQTNIQLNEEWAFRVGDYGSYSTYSEIEFNLEEGTYLENPYVIKLVDNVPDNKNPLINYVDNNNLVIKPINYISTSTFDVYESTFDDNNLVLLTAGYPRINDVTATAYNLNSILDIENFDNVEEGSTLWVGFLENGDWDILRYTEQTPKIIGVYVSSPGIDITFVTDINHKLKVNDIIVVKQFNDQVNGIYKVKDITKLTQFTVESDLTTIVDEDLLSPGILFKFDSCRYSDIDSLKDDNRILTLKNNDKIWIDKDLDEKWKVYQKIDNFDYKTYESVNVVYGGQQLGQQIFAVENSKIVLVSAPGKWNPTKLSYGSVSVFEIIFDGSLEQKYEYVLNDTTATYCDSTLPTEFGYSLAYDINKGYFFAGAPAASNIRAPLTTGLILSTGSGTIKTFENEGLVKVSIRKSDSLQDLTQAIIVHPNAISTSTASHARFGHSLYVNNVSINTATTLIVGAPGDNENTGTGQVFAFSISTASNITITEHTSGIEINSTSTIELTNGSRWGYSISGDTLGNNIAISAPNYFNTLTTQYGVVQIFNENLVWKQSILPVDNLTGKFGDSVSISKSGNYLLISSINSILNNNSYGYVFLYKLNSSNSYELYQTLQNPISNSNLKFGYDISINDDENSIVISALGNSVSNLELDANLEDTTIFDSNSTLFFNKIIDSGTVFVYNKLGNYFVNTTELNDVEILEGSKYGSSVISLNNTVFIGAPSGNNVGVQSVNLLSSLTVSISTTLTVEFSAPTQIDGTLPVATISYKDVTGLTKTIDTIEILYSGSGYLYPPDAIIKDQYDNTVTNAVIVYLNPDDSKVYQFSKIDQTINGFKLLREQENTVDIDKIKKISLIDNFKEEIVEYLDIIDPLKGKIAGIADQELKYKLISDPAVYSVGVSSTINDDKTSWIDDHVGELWWDLSTAKFLWYEQGDDIFRKNNWGRLFPGASIDVYEWVRSSLLPSEWASQADTNEGLTKGISGQPKHPDNTVLSVKQIYNNITGSFENVYYFWVKNKVLVPNNTKRRISALQVALNIADPLSNGLKFVSILSSNSVAFSNVQQMLRGNRINANLVLDTINNTIPKHTEWLLLEEGNPTSIPTTLLEKKLIDSLLGHDYLGNIVPDSTLSNRNKYGLGIRPQQTLFKNRNNALRNIVEFVNSVLLKNRTTGLYNFESLLKEEQIPNEFSREYDEILENNLELEFYNTVNFVRTELECFVENGKITNVVIKNPGFGYKIAPEIIINDSNNSAKLLSTIDDQGRVVDVYVENSGSSFEIPPTLIVRPHTVIVTNDENVNNKWSKNVFDYQSNSWIRQKTQSYNTPLFWNYVDWKDETYIDYKPINYVLGNLYELDSITNIVNVGDYIKINNQGNGFYIILEKISDTQSSNYIKNYNLVYSENGTIQIKNSLWNFNLSNYSYDKLTLDETLYDQIPDLEILYIFEALKNDIFIKDLKVNWNLLFFVAVKYALTEQKLLDWAFKTSFVSLKNTIGSLNQKEIYKLDNGEYFEDYIKEIKPYRTKLRNSTLAYNTLENTSINITDFDLPFYFNEETLQNESALLNNTILQEYPWKNWNDNYKYQIGEILIAEQGEGYTQRPSVNIISQSGDTGSGATAEAYLRNGKIYQIVLTNPGSGYTKNPYVVITGGGSSVTKTATASATLSNKLIRKNIIGIKFDRYSFAPEINFDKIYDKFICDGISVEFKLSWYAKPQKETITAKLDGRLIYSADYILLFDNKEKKSIFKFLNFVPNEGQIIEIAYEKNINLFNAVERIEEYYNPTDTMYGKDYTLLMSGYEYPNTVIQGLPFKYVTPWNPNFNPFGEFIWDELTEKHISTKLTSTATIGDSLIYLDNVNGIQIGQTINIINSSTTRVRADTVVKEINTNSIVISNPTYDIKLIKALGTTPGSDIIVRTKKNFYETIKQGDIALISLVSTSEFNGQYMVKSIESNNTFIVTAISFLSTTTAIMTTSSKVIISSILETIPSDNVLFNHFINTVTDTSIILIDLYTPSNFIKKAKVIVNGVVISNTVSPGIYYGIFESSGNQYLFVDNLTTTSTINVSLYTNPSIEIWTPKTLYSELDSGIEAGSWTGTNFIGALGINPEDHVIDGSNLLSQSVGYGPEELVNGYVLDSLGINVYTQTEQNINSLVITGAFPASYNTETSFTLSFLPIAWAGLMIYNGSVIFERISDRNYTKENQYYVEGNTVYIPQQSNSIKIGYTIMTVGGENVLDSNIVVVNTSTALVESLASINDVNHAYVLVNGVEVDKLTTSTDFGYVLTNSNADNNRACVIVYNMPAGINTVEAWFFNSYHDKFNRINEEYFDITSPQAVFVLSKPPANIKPESAHAIVELSSNSDLTRRRLMPPWVSYYEIIDNQRTFAIDNKNSRPSGYYSIEEIKVYANGIELRPGFDYTVNLINNTITLTDELLNDGDAIAIMPTKDYEYIISDNILQLATPASDSTMKVMTFTDHDNLLMNTEQFVQNGINRYVLSRPVLNDNYIWVYVNGIPLVHRYDFEVLDDLHTIQFSEWIVTNTGDSILITTLSNPSSNNLTLGFRIFKDMFERSEYKRISEYHSTYLVRELNVFDTEIHVYDDDELMTPDPNRNKPGVIIVDGERIEFFEKSNNVLKQLRRSTLGTGPAKYSQVGTTIIDQSIQQSVPYKDITNIQTIKTTNTNTYIISTETSTSTGHGIILDFNINAVDQITVYYGGRQLRKSSLVFHDLVVSYNPTSTSLKTSPPEFTVNTSTQELVLNISETISTGTDITIIQKKGYVWTGTESLLTSNVPQAEFLRKKPAALPDIYYYGGSRELLDESYRAITNENDNPLEE